MQRRSFLQGAGTTVTGVAVLSSQASASSHNDIAETFFDPLREMDKNQLEQALVGCARALCTEKWKPTGPTDELVDDVDRINHNIRRVRFGVRILNEHNITSVIDESMVQKTENFSRNATRFVPLVGSFNNLQAAACAVDDNPGADSVEDFIYASLAFGLEVGLWHSSVPYQMAWRGTRFTANRTFLRYANHGCNGCIAAVMSELHWALRSVPFAIASEESIEATKTDISQLVTTIHDGENFDPNLNFTPPGMPNQNNSTVGGGAVFVPRSSTGNGEVSPLFGLAGIGIALYVLMNIFE